MSLLFAYMFSYVTTASSTFSSHYSTSFASGCTVKKEIISSPFAHTSNM